MHLPSCMDKVNSFRVNNFVLIKMYSRFYRNAQPCDESRRVMVGRTNERTKEKEEKLHFKKRLRIVSLFFQVGLPKSFTYVGAPFVDLCLVMT